MCVSLKHFILREKVTVFVLVIGVKNESTGCLYISTLLGSFTEVTFIYGRGLEMDVRTRSYLDRTRSTLVERLKV